MTTEATDAAQEAIDLFRKHHLARRESCQEAINRLTREREEIDDGLERLREAERLLSADGAGAPPTPAPELKPSSDDDPPPAQQLPSQAPAEEPSQPPSSRAATTFLRRQALVRQIEVMDDGNGLRVGELENRLSGAAFQSRSSLTRDLSVLVADGSLRRTGNKSTTRYFPGDGDGPAPPPVKEGPSSSRGSQEITVEKGTPEGRILEYVTLNPRSSGPAIALGTGISLNEVRPILGKLMRETDVRAGHENGETVYSGTP